MNHTCQEEEQGKLQGPGAVAGALVLRPHPGNWSVTGD